MGDASIRESMHHTLTAWYQDPFGGDGSYRRLSTAALVHQAPAVSSNVGVTVLHGGRAYCISDVEAPVSGTGPARCRTG
jgi:hypothetical protein